MWFITFVYKNITRRPLRSFLTVFAIAIAIGSFLTLVGIASGFERSFLRLYESTGVDIIVTRKGIQQGLSSLLDERLADKIKKVPGVNEVIGGLADMLALAENPDAMVVVNGWEPETAAFANLRMVEERTLTRADDRSVLLGIILARNLGKKVGDSVELLENEPFRVVGIYDNSNVFLDGALVVALKEMQRFMDRKGRVTGFSLVMEDSKKDPASIAAALSQIERLGPNLLAQDRREFVRSRPELQLAKGMAWLTSLIALLIGTFGMMNTMVMSIHERTREIGTLRAVGWRRGRVIRMVLSEAFLLSLLGAFIAVAGSLILLRILTHVPLVNGFVDGHLDPVLIVEGFAIAVAVGILGGVLPARRAAWLLPVAALRHE